jgi:hypothetical protein
MQIIFATTTQWPYQELMTWLNGSRLMSYALIKNSGKPLEDFFDEDRARLLACRSVSVRRAHVRKV